jgi:hypothetical protein
MRGVAKTKALARTALLQRLAKRILLGQPRRQRPALINSFLSLRTALPTLKTAKSL